MGNLKPYSEDNQLRLNFENENENEDDNLGLYFDKTSELNDEDEEQNQLGASGSFKVTWLYLLFKFFEQFLFVLLLDKIYFNLLYKIKNRKF